MQVRASVPEAFWDEFHNFQREGGFCAVRTWKPGLSTHSRYLARTCSVPVALVVFLGADSRISTTLPIWQSLVRRSPMEYRIVDFSGRCHPDGFRIQLLLVQHWIHVYVSLRRLLVQTTEHCGVSAVAVH